MSNKNKIHNDIEIMELDETRVIQKKAKPSQKSKKKKRKKLTWGVVIKRIFIFIGITVAILIVFLLSLVFVLLKGPSEQATKLFALSAHETSAMKWLPALFLSEAEYDAILNPVIQTDDFKALPMESVTNNQSLNASDVEIQEKQAMEIIDIKGGTYQGKLLIVHDSSKVTFASIDSFGGAGLTLSAFLNKYDAVACTNAGGFADEGGRGTGGIPDGVVIRDGKIVYGSAGGSYSGFAGFDSEHILHVGNLTGQQAIDMGIVSGTNFTGGPVLIKDGVRQTGFVSGINPRTAIGQTADGTVLMLCIEGRMADSLGATFDDLADIMEEYGAVNAVNMDGGSSSGLYYEGERLTRSSSVVGDRPLPTAIIVLR